MLALIPLDASSARYRVLASCTPRYEWSSKAGDGVRDTDVLADRKPEPLGRPGLVEHATASLTCAPSQPQQPSQP